MLTACYRVLGDPYSGPRYHEEDPGPVFDSPVTRHEVFTESYDPLAGGEQEYARPNVRVAGVKSVEKPRPTMFLVSPPNV